MGCLALTDLDTGLFFDRGTWTHNYNLAQRFQDHSSIAKVATELKVKSAAAAFIEGDPPRVHGYFWITDVNQNTS